ncbi:alpha-L-rhamnosidase N-terminal domain-containing protein [Cohnella sp. REN36]|uniref:alpha-L-rhamnosidase-related protein n=1 Tax=Cohnella sp. REN36 TaxID=2887347 RepID=UPI001D15D9CB|nr:family 78 glycoside hydrolase catalytic domain [Cohnella sp. REN36]MCC3375279.1 family 78 glycoside hydrolase catalytic domain [Cohnella sp. REN36]
MEENKAWQASWIWADRASRGRPDGNELVYFRRTFRLADASVARLLADVSADSRYRLYVNGVSVSTGPARGDLRTHYYETVDLSPYLADGINVLAVKVLHYAPGSPRPSAIPSAHTGALLLQGRVTDRDGRETESLDTDGSWVCRIDDAVAFLPESYTCVGGGESVEGDRLPHGWHEAGYDDRDWKRAVVVAPTHREYDGFLEPWQLTRRTIPPMFERNRAFVRAMRAETSPGAVLGEASSEREWLRLPAYGTAVVELDAGELTTGYMRMVMAGGRGSEIAFLCSECYESEDGVKGMRDRAEGGVLRGYRERYAVSGRTEGDEAYETFLFRTFRFVRLEISAGSEPLAVHRVHYRETGYPLEVRASFEASDESLGPLWDVSVRSLQRCMHEGYYDCPFYEQLQYSMDTRLQALFTYAIDGDDRLARKAIYEFHSSLLPGGMLLSRYPSIQPQVIPGFALYWILMLHDHLLYYGDAAHAARYRPTVDAVLDWFARRIGSDGLVGAAPRGYWSYVDWVKEWERTRGVPSAEGPLTVYNLMYADALEKAAVINAHTGRPETAREYRDRAKAIVAAVNASCRSEERGLYRDGPGLDSYSQHAQIWAILAGAVRGSDATGLASRLMEDSSLLQVSYSMAYFLFRALSEAGRYETGFALWDRWREQIGLHLTTWLEDPVSQRSDCHAWGAVPLWEFTSEILGVKPAGIGYERIRIEPRPGPLRWARGKAVTRHGPVKVAWEIVEGSFRLQAAGLNGRPTDIRLPDGSSHRVEGSDTAAFACRLPG